MPPHPLLVPLWPGPPTRREQHTGHRPLECRNHHFVSTGRALLQCNEPNQGFPSKFDFRRLGGRATALLMGGRVPKKVFQEPEHGALPNPMPGRVHPTPPHTLRPVRCSAACLACISRHSRPSCSTCSAALKQRHHSDQLSVDLSVDLSRHLSNAFTPCSGPEPSSEFDLASIASTVHRLFNLSTALTRRC